MSPENPSRVFNIVDRTATVLVIENNISLRSLYNNVLKSLGYTHIYTTNEISIALGVLESEVVDWVLCSPQTENKLNIYHLLNMCIKYDGLKETLITTTLSDSEKKHIPHITALGCFSWFLSKSTEDHIRSSLEEIIRRIKIYKCDPTLITLSFLEDFLRDSQKHSELINTYRNLMSLYPGNTALLLKMAESQLLAGKKKEGSLTLQQACTMNIAAKPEAQSIADKYLSGVLPSISSGSTDQNPFGLKECFICKIDDSSKEVIENLFTETFAPFKYFSSSENCLDDCEKTVGPDLLISGWWNDGLNTAAFLQRFRIMKPHSVIVIIAHKLDSAEIALLNEMNCAVVLKPPLLRDKFLETLVWLIQQDNRPLEKSFLIIKIRQSLESGKIDRAIKFKESLQSNPLASQGDILLSTSEILLKQGNYEASLAIAIDALKYGGDSVACLNTMGRSFLKLGKFDKAFQAFDQAQELSPLNVKRLCSMAEASFELGGDVSDLLIEASIIDENSRAVKSTEAKTKIASGNTNAGRNILAQLSSIKDIIAYLNNKAVTAALDRKYDEAVALYEQALESVPDLHAKYRTVVNYNLGILHLRMGQMDQAEKVLQRCVPKEDASISEKASQLLENIKQARAANKQLKMMEKEAPPPFQLNEEHLKKIKRGIRLAKVETIINKGERCLYHIFYSPEKLKIVLESLSYLPSFKVKESIELDNKKVFL